jgi:hypothetical protein
MWRCVDLALTDVSEERIATIFRVEKSASGEPASAGGWSHIPNSIFTVLQNERAGIVIMLRRSQVRILARLSSILRSFVVFLHLPRKTPK